MMSVLPECPLEGFYCEVATGSVYLSVCQVSNTGSDIEVTMVAEQNPFRQDALLPGDCFILDNGANGQLYIWKGPNCD